MFGLFKINRDEAKDGQRVELAVSEVGEALMREGRGWSVEQEFTISASSGNYASEMIFLAHNSPLTVPAASDDFDSVNEMQVDVGTLVTGITVEVDILIPNGHPAVASDWATARYTYTTAGNKVPVPFSRVEGIRVRVKSGGTAGAQKVRVWWW